jgi:Domain of unknown function (DUF4349)
MNEETTVSLIDAALASGAATALDPEERALQELVLTVRDDAPTPAADFRLRMDARVAAGFPPRRARRPRLFASAWQRPRLAALGAAASLLIAIVVAVAVLGGGDHSANVAAIPATHEPQRSAAGPVGSATAGSGSASSSASAAPRTSAHALGGTAGATLESAPADKAVAPSATPIEPPIPAPGPDTVRGGQSRKVQLSAALVLGAPQDKLGQVGDQVVAVTDRYGGIVMSSSVTDSGGVGASGYFDLRIPVRNLSAALRDLSQLADVESRTENSQDVTASFVSAHTRIQELMAERKGLLKRLANATTDNEVAAIKAQLRFVNSELNGATRQLQLLRRRTNLATVSVTLAVKKGHSGGAGGIGKGWHDLGRSLVDSASIGLRVLGVAIPIALLVALIWAANAWMLRRRREAALDRL